MATSHWSLGWLSYGRVGGRSRHPPSNRRWVPAGLRPSVARPRRCPEGVRGRTSHQEPALVRGGATGTQLGHPVSRLPDGPTSGPSMPAGPIVGVEAGHCRLCDAPGRQQARPRWHSNGRPVRIRVPRAPLRSSARRRHRYGRACPFRRVLIQYRPYRLPVGVETHLRAKVSGMWHRKKVVVHGKGGDR